MSKTPESTPSAAQMGSPTYELAAFDRDFILSDSMRGVRYLLEFAKTDQALRAWGVRSTIVVFGSARFAENGPPQHAAWYAAAREFAAIASREGGAYLAGARERNNVICTGGGPGIMEAANRGASDVGAPSIGLNITLPREQGPNPYSTPELTFRFHYFAMRKMHFAMRANALVVFPGGFGTMDEVFELLTLRQTGKSPPIPIVLFDENFWRSIINFDAMIDAGVIAPDDLNLFRYAETPRQIWDQLIAGGLKPNEERGSWERKRDDQLK